MKYFLAHKLIFIGAFLLVLLIGTLFLLQNKSSTSKLSEITQTPTASTTEVSIADFNLPYDNHANKQKAQQLGISMREYGLIFFDNKQDKDGLFGFVPEAGSGFYYIFHYPRSWVGRMDFVEVMNGEREPIWKTQVEGLGSYRFLDLNGDGINEIVINSDGGGNRPTCVVEYHRWEGNTFVPVNFIGEDNEASPTMDCSFSGNIGFEGLKTIYTASEWKRTTDTRLEPVYWKCDREEIIYTYDGKDFRETSREVVERDVSELDNNLVCYG